MSNEYKTIAEEDVENIRNGHTYKLKVYLIPWRDEYHFELEDITDIDLDVHDFLGFSVKDKEEGLAELEKWRDRLTLSKHAFAMKQASRLVDSGKDFAFYAEYTYDGFTRRWEYSCKVSDDGYWEVDSRYNRDYQVEGYWVPDTFRVLSSEQLKDFIAKQFTDGFYVGTIEKGA